MNRINKYTINNKQYFDVLITPNYTSNPSFELVLGNWLDEDFNLYYIITTKSLQEAMNISWKYPDIDWERLVNMYKDNYLKLNKTLSIYLKRLSIPLTYESHILTPIEAKQTFFKRVKNHNKRFTLYYDMNDIISFDIIVPYTKTAELIKNELVQIPELNIKKIIKSKSQIKLIGYTEFNTTYEIRIWTTLYHNFFKWLYMNNLKLIDYEYNYKKIISQQNLLDNSYN